MLFSNGNKYFFIVTIYIIIVECHICIRRNCFSKNISWMAYNKNRSLLRTLFITAAHVSQVRENEILYTIWSYCSEGATAFFRLFHYIRALPHSLFLSHSLSLQYIYHFFEGWLPLITGEQWTLPKLQVPKISASIVTGSHGAVF